jgi:hypothetical protein
MHLSYHAALVNIFPFYSRARSSYIANESVMNVVFDEIFTDFFESRALLKLVSFFSTGLAICSLVCMLSFA